MESSAHAELRRALVRVGLSLSEAETLVQSLGRAGYAAAEVEIAQRTPAALSRVSRAAGGAAAALGLGVAGNFLTDALKSLASLNSPKKDSPPINNDARDLDLEYYPDRPHAFDDYTWNFFVSGPSAGSPIRSYVRRLGTGLAHKDLRRLHLQSDELTLSKEDHDYNIGMIYRWCISYAIDFPERVSPQVVAISPPEADGVEHVFISNLHLYMLSQWSYDLRLSFDSLVSRIVHSLSDEYQFKRVLSHASVKSLRSYYLAPNKVNAHPF